MARPTDQPLRVRTRPLVASRGMTGATSPSARVLAKDRRGNRPSVTDYSLSFFREWAKRKAIGCNAHATGEFVGGGSGPGECHLDKKGCPAPFRRRPPGELNTARKTGQPRTRIRSSARLQPKIPGIG